jgi:type II secretory pathway pseudopilin PulG
MGSRHAHRISRSLGSEAGFGLVEVVISAALLSLVSVGVFAGIDGPSSASGDTRARGVAAALADQDQERLRALKAADLPDADGSRSVLVAGVTYTVVSETAWVSDASGTESCTSNSSEADYMRITSRVTWPGLAAGKKPATNVSIIALPVGGLGGQRGNLAVKLLDPVGAALEGIPVTVTPGSKTVSTNAYGCAYFGQIVVGNYQAALAKPGWVDPSGNSAVTLSGSVTNGTTSTLSTQLGQAGAVDVSFDTLVAGASVAATAQSISVSQPSLPSPGFRTFAPGGARSLISATSLFPFASGYGIYGGNCAGANPATYDAAYWPSRPGFVLVGAGAHPAVTVRLPPLNVRVVRSSVALANARMIATPTSSGCTGPTTMTTGSNGYPTQRGVPFGSYFLCADDGVRRVFSFYTNTVADGKASVDMTIASSGTSTQGICT